MLLQSLMLSMGDKVYCYPNTKVLVNKMNIRSLKELQEAEMNYTSARLFQIQENPVVGNFDFVHLLKIHEYIFQDLFEWAGKIRTIDISKGESLFCRVFNINSYAEDIFSHYYDDCYANRKNKEKFIDYLVKHYADVNALHPFREGNGRAQREFARELCIKCGYIFDLSTTTHEQMLNASILSFTAGNLSGLKSIFSAAVIPEENYIDKDKEKLNILTIDDLDVEEVVETYEYYEDS